MSTFRVTAEPLTILEHPNADALELAQVGLYRAVVGKGQFETGNYAVYIPEQAVLPADLIEELGLTGRLAGKDKDRVKAVRLRGELSQGIVCRPTVLADVDLAHAHSEDLDFAELLGITKWVPPIPVGMSGTVEPAPGLMSWIDIENIKRYPGVFEDGEPVEATEKLHGTACLTTYDSDDNSFHVTSKGFGGKGLALVEDETNLYWRAVNQHAVAAAAALLCGYLDARRVGLFGEVYGKGVQDLHYGKDAGHDETLGYALFDVSVMDKGGEVRWLSGAEIDELWAITVGEAGPMVRVPRAPLIYRGPYDYDALAALAEGRSLLDPGTIREGLVVRPAVERRSELLGGRAIAKFISPSYLTRKGGTEFE
jgi:RNA ligase (TIGR02306 family)